MKYNDETIILIEYFHNIPFSVYTEFCTFNFELYAGNSWLMFCESGGGKNWREENGKKIFEFTYSWPEVWKVWIDSQYILVPEIQKGLTLLKKPLMLPEYYDGK